MEPRKLLHNELRAAATSFRAGEMLPDEFFPKMITFLHDHLWNLGLSDRAARWWLYDRSPEEWKIVKSEFANRRVDRGLCDAIMWLDQLARITRAFRLRSADQIRDNRGRVPPFLDSVMWRYYYRDHDPKGPGAAKTDPLPRFEMPVRDDGSRMIRRPWV